jgi:superfamily II DNA or RNA helicase
MDAKASAAALTRLQPQPGGRPPLAVATGPYIGEGFDCPALDTLFLAALARLQPQPGGPPLLAVATVGEGFDCPALDTLFLAAPVGQGARPPQGRRAVFSAG